MTLRTNARLAGFAFLFYIAVGITHMVLFRQATSGTEGTAATLAAMAEHANLVRVGILFTLLESLSALVLGVTLHALTRDVDRDLAVMALCCRAGEAVLGAIAASRGVQLLGLATAAAGVAPSDAVATNVLAASLLKGGGLSNITATCFAVGSTIFCYLFLRARSIPVLLAWLGLVSSLLWVIGLPLQVTGFLRGAVITYSLYIPLGVFEVAFAIWLLVTGFSISAQKPSTFAPIGSS